MLYRAQPPEDAVGHPKISVEFFYTTKVPRDGYKSIPFFSALNQKFSQVTYSNWKLHFHFTGTPTASSSSIYDASNSVFVADQDQPRLGLNQVIHERRITHVDLIKTLGPIHARPGVVACVCGPSGMTDEFVSVLKNQPGMKERHVFSEKWV